MELNTLLCPQRKQILEDKENAIIFYAHGNQLMKTNQVYLDIKLTSDYV